MNLFEAKLIAQLNDILGCRMLDTIFKAISALGDKGFIWICIAFLCVIFKKTRKCGICVAAALIICLLVGNAVLKPLIARTRPFDVLPSLEIIIPKPTDFSFPSGHTLASFASATAVFANHRRCGTLAYIFAALMAFSRIYLCVHYPTDVLCGVLFGIIFGLSAYGICTKCLGKDIKNEV